MLAFPDATVGLTVLLPTPAYMLAMKILANRLVEDVDTVQSDLDDVSAPHPHRR